MTREEAKTYLENYRKMFADLAPERFLEALDCILSQPSLPSDLDEAAFKYEDSSEYPPANQEEERMVYDAFKAGAEWMAGQGESIVAKIGLATEEICCTISEETLDSLGVQADDEIILQIRKK